MRACPLVGGYLRGVPARHPLVQFGKEARPDGLVNPPRRVSIQRFDSRFKDGTDPDSEIDFLLPVVPRA